MEIEIRCEGGVPLLETRTRNYQRLARISSQKAQNVGTYLGERQRREENSPKNVGLALEDVELSKGLSVRAASVVTTLASSANGHSH